MSALLLVLLLLHAPAMTPAQRPPLCPAPTNGTRELMFTSELATLALECNRQKVDLLCCAQGFTTISWYRLAHGGWELYSPQESDRFLDESGQVLTLMMASHDLDSGEYGCVAAGGGGAISHNVKLAVSECGDLLTTPHITSPTQHVHQVELTTNYSVQCTAMCGKDPATHRSDCHLGWARRRLGPDGEQVEPLAWDTCDGGGGAGGVSPCVHPTEILDGNGAELTLTFVRVKPADFGQYECTAFSEYAGRNNQTSVVVTLTEKAPPPLQTTLALGLEVAAVICLALATIAAALYLNRHRLTLVWMLRFASPKHLLGKDTDMFVLFAEDDTEEEDFTTSVLQQELQEHSGLQYTVTSQLDVPLGSVAFSQIGALAMKANHLLVLVTSRLIEDDGCVTSFLNLQSTHYAFHVIFVIRDADWQEQWTHYVNTACPERKKEDVMSFMRSVQVGKKIKCIKGKTKSKVFLVELQARLSLPIVATAGMDDDVTVEGEPAQDHVVVTDEASSRAESGRHTTPEQHSLLCNGAANQADALCV